MLSNRDYKRVHYLIQIAFIAVFIFLAYLAVKYVFGAIAPFIIAFIVASLAEPLVNLLVRKVHLPRGAASTLCVLSIIAILVVIGVFLSTTIWSEGKVLVSKIPGYLLEVINYLKDALNGSNSLLAFLPDNILDNTMTYLMNYDYSSLVTGSLGSKVLGYAGNVVVYIPNVLIFVIVTIVSSVFMSISFPIVKRFVLAQFNPKHQELIIDIKSNLFSTVWNYLRSYSILMLITFIELSVFFLIFRFKPAIPLAFLIAIVDILPVLGVGTVLIPWSVFSLLTGDPWRALILISMYIIITVVRQVLEPKIIGDNTGMLPIVTLFCIWAGLKLFGFGGMFLLPISVVILKNLHEEGKIHIWKFPKIQE